MSECTHAENLPDAPARTQGCEECLASGESWLQLRRCLTCGHVGCCDSSRYRHAAKHFAATHHPVIQSSEPGET
jgi:hypothetical protein